MEDNELNVIQPQRCDNLRWKGLFHSVDAQPDEHSVFWCAKTQFAFGPDGKFVDNAECNPSRSCYCPL